MRSEEYQRFNTTQVYDIRMDRQDILSQHSLWRATAKIQVAYPSISEYA